MALTNCYCTLSDLKTSLAIEDIQDDTALEAAILTASRMIDDYTGRFFYRDGTTAAPVTRYYTPDSWYITNLDDFVSLNQIALDDDFDQTYTTILAASDYLIDPVNNARRGWPYNRITAIDRYIFPYAYPQSVRVQAVWGWPSVPAEISMATKLQASRLKWPPVSALPSHSPSSFLCSGISSSRKCSRVLMLRLWLQPTVQSVL